MFSFLSVLCFFSETSCYWPCLVISNSCLEETMSSQSLYTCFYYIPFLGHFFSIWIPENLLKFSSHKNSVSVIINKLFLFLFSDTISVLKYHFASFYLNLSKLKMTFKDIYLHKDSLQFVLYFFNPSKFLICFLSHCLYTFNGIISAQYSKIHD